MSGQVREILAGIANDIGEPWSDDIRNDVASDALKVLQGRIGPLVAAAQLTVQHFKRSQASGNFQGDDEHECWTALSAALAALERET